MAISSIPPVSTGSFQSSNPIANVRQTFQQLANAVKSGDLSGAQSAFAALSQLQADGQGPAPGANTPFAQTINQIGQALQNGDLPSAQQALASFTQQTHAHHHGGHHRSSTEEAASTDTAPSATNGNGQRGATPQGLSVDVTT